MAATHYIIRGGLEGRERLRVLARVLRPSTLALFERVGVQPGSVCLDAGCGGGDVTFELARIVGPEGRVIGIDLDEAKLDVARKEAVAQGITNIEFRVAEVGRLGLHETFDLVYCRFVLTHLSNPQAALLDMLGSLRPGGRLLVVDIDCSGYFWYPDNRAQSRFLDLYIKAATRRGGDPNIGQRLPSLLIDAGLSNVQMNIVQLAALQGEVKLIAPITMENIADTLIADGLASADEIRQIVTDLYEFARSPDTVGALPRIVEVWGQKPEV